MTKHIKEHQKNSGSVLITSIVFMSVFMILFSSLMSYLLTQYKWAEIKTEETKALHIAEAGIEYYRWRMSHFPTDLTDGTGGPGPYVHVYDDPDSGAIGEFSLEIGGDLLCGEVQVVHATSTGWTYKKPTIKRSISVQIARPTVADYSYIVDSNVWAGSSRTIIGPYHSNGVIRMDADNRSAVTSKVDTASCSATGLGGCTGTINGVYGTGSHPEWWLWNQADIPFTNFDYDFGQMENTAKTDGIYLPKVSDDTSSFGYYLVFRSDKKVDIYEVDNIWNWITSYAPGGNYETMPELTGNMNNYRHLIRTDDIPQACPLIYVSDRTWIEGVVSGKVTVVANDIGAATPDMFIQGNITYATSGDVDGLTALAERYLLIPLYVPNDMTINGVFFAQKGAYGRSHYGSVWPYNSYRYRNSLTTNGTIVSKLRTGTAWSDGQGFSIRNDLYDRNLAKTPPPLTPFTSPDFRFIEWSEVQ